MRIITRKTGSKSPKTLSKEASLLVTAKRTKTYDTQENTTHKNWKATSMRQPYATIWEVIPRKPPGSTTTDIPG